MSNVHVTFLVFTYNHQDYIRPCLKSVLSQTYSPMDVFIWDNASTDNNPSIIKETLDAYNGPHSVTFHPNDKNLYPGFELINTVVPQLKGEFIVFLAGDDISAPDRVEKLVRARKKTGACAMSSSYIEIDEMGKKGQQVSSLSRKGRTPLTTVDQFIKFGGSSANVGSGLAYDKNVFTYFGPLRDGPRNVDVMIPFRGALLSCAYYVDEPLVYRRIHSDNVSLVVKKDQESNPAEQMVIKERQLSNRAANWIKILEDFDFYFRKNPRDPRNLSTLRGDLLERVAKVTRRWVGLRHQMMMEGLGIV